ncbi:hypothetical protein ASPZODRAFT_18067 [Penicilliopsis zonata CBS 506.65]|uniref:Uncharacterized protein n=1 Tax=Penicilliopsis zonata CBS 506.65 TaxID=1073090 RepID=A0A1L9SDA4_9EURO|nr:hypothetical protein ASPZODRAFT_18067 [Penicilliopsis zonata CBS 506.65]OJJ45161.1 hypothetical protein ASPZODRAFT_18067 [Penicilliopsis zonata CBS 506.65]
MGDHGDALVGVSIAISIVQIAAVAARFYTRYWQQVPCRMDDYLIILASVVTLIHSISHELIDSLQAACSGQAALYIFLVYRGIVGRHLEIVEQLPLKLVILGKGLYGYKEKKFSGDGGQGF